MCDEIGRKPHFMTGRTIYNSERPIVTIKKYGHKMGRELIPAIFMPKP